MQWENFTAGRVAGFECQAGKKQSIYWDGKTPGLGLRVTATGSKAYIFETSLNNKTIRLTIGDARTWSISRAQGEATRLKTLTDQGTDPRQVKKDVIAEKQAKVDAISAQQIKESVTVRTAWNDYIRERSAAIKNSRPVWGARHIADHARFVKAGGEIRKRGTRPGESNIVQPGILVPLMDKRLIDLDAKALAAWLDKAASQAPATAAQSFRALRAFLTWCGKQEAYSAAIHADVCQTDVVKDKVPAAKTKKNDSLRKAQRIGHIALG
ncbi:MAG: Arm DNA-binding domain-containing protein [Rugosibacter sp.]